MDLLEYLDHRPAPPPSYAQIHRAKTQPIRFPVFERPESHELPAYAPAVYSMAIVLRKVEWLSPYEPSSCRSWKPYVMELNSTQLNFYSIDAVPLIGKSHHSSISKIKSLKHQQNLVFCNQIERDLVVEAVRRFPKKYLSSDNLVRSYTLQHAKVGLPVDYKKRKYCLRFRLETEQILVQFSSLDEMIRWANEISTGINVSLDLEARPLPTDRSVPRRRRRGSRRNAWGRHSHHENGSGNRVRSYSDSDLIRRELNSSSALVNSGILLAKRRRSSISGGGIFGKIFGRRKASGNDTPHVQSSTAACVSTMIAQLGESPDQEQRCRPSFSASDSPEEEAEKEEGLDEGEELVYTFSNDIHTDDQEEREEEEEEEEFEDQTDLDNQIIVGENDSETPDSDIHSVSQLGDEFDDEEVESLPLSEEQDPRNEIDQLLRDHLRDFHFYDDSEKVKWSPAAKLVSESKLLKDAIRCIKLLPDNETWIGKSIMIPAKPPKFETCNRISCSNNDSPLKHRNKYMKEFVVGAQGLISVES